MNRHHRAHRKTTSGLTAYTLTHRWSARATSGFGRPRSLTIRHTRTKAQGREAATAEEDIKQSENSRARSRAAAVAVHEVDSSGESIHQYARVDGAWTATTGERGGTTFKATEKVKGALLPEGFPNSVTPDYLDYQLWALPTHITGWLASALVTSTLLKAVGIGASPTAAAAAGAAIKWITKDGIGALGRFLVGSSLGRYMDEDPRFWRMVAAGIHICGASLEIVTARNPSAFIVLATSGNLAKAVSKGIGRPSFRVVQNHFAAGQNVGDVAAKEEIWEVCGQLTGLACSVALLNGLALIPDPTGEHIIGVWLSIQIANIVLRYKALSMLQLPWLSQRRAVSLASTFVNGEALPTVKALCSSESFALPKQLQQPGLLMNASVAQLSQAATALQVGGGLLNAGHRRSANNGTGPALTGEAAVAAENGSNPSTSSSAGRAERSRDNETEQSPSNNGNGYLREARASDSATDSVGDVSYEVSNGTRPGAFERAGHPHGLGTSSKVSSTGNGVAGGVGQNQQDDFSSLLALYAEESYVLIPSAQFVNSRANRSWLQPGQDMLVGVKKEAKPPALLRAVLQAAWLHKAIDDWLMRNADKPDDLWRKDAADLLLQSLEFARSNNEAFVDALRSRGWDVEDVRMRSNQASVLSVMYADV